MEMDLHDKYVEATVDMLDSTQDLLDMISKTLPMMWRQALLDAGCETMDDVHFYFGSMRALTVMRLKTNDRNRWAIVARRVVYILNKETQVEDVIRILNSDYMY